MKDINLLPPIEVIKRELCKRSFYYFFVEFWDVIIPEKPVLNWHIKYLCDELQTAIEKLAKRKDKDSDIIINIPPGTSKSTIATVMLPVWAWIIDPSIRSLTASYSSSLSTDHSVKSRDIIRSEKFKSYFPDIQIKQDQDNKTHYKNNQGGERYATSVTGTVTGFHAHLIVVDDPLNPREATSDVDRLTANNFMDVTLSTRKVSKSATLTILVMQRLHQMDCTGNWLSKQDKKIKHICLPGELSSNVRPLELAKHYENGLLDKRRLTKKDLNELMVNLGSYGYAGQIMQVPSPEGGGLWQKWINEINNDEIPVNLDRLGTDWDLAYTEKETNSASAYVTAGLHDNKMYIVDLGFEWLEFPKLINYMRTKQMPHYIEGKASGKSAKQVLTNQGIPAIEVQVMGGDKTARAQMAAPYVESGMVYCPKRLLDRLYNDSRQGLLIFPNGEHDDLNDAFVQSVNRLLATKKLFFI